MTIWEKFRHELIAGASTATEKASDLLKIGTEALQESAEKVSAKAAYSAKLAEVNSENRKIASDMEIEFAELGKIFFKLESDKRLSELDKEAKKHFDTLAALEKELQKNQKAKDELARQHEIETMEIESVHELTKNLEEGGGTILQVVLHASCSFLGKSLKEVTLPKEALIGTILRDEKVIIPDGETKFKAGDKVSILGRLEDVEKTVKLFAGEKI
ncbi:MAG: TrkA C-terminal domain-containing protein [bacterium]